MGTPVVLLVAPFVASAHATIANVATPAMRTGFAVSATEAQFVIGTYVVAYAVLLITGARLGSDAPVNAAVVDVAHAIERGDIHPDAYNLETLLERVPMSTMLR